MLSATGYLTLENTHSCIRPIAALQSGSNSTLAYKVVGIFFDHHSSARDLNSWHLPIFLKVK